MAADMKCSNCGTINNAAAKVCLECGQGLDIVCHLCGSPNHPESKFCNECGKPIEFYHAYNNSNPLLSRHISPRQNTVIDPFLKNETTGERKHVTVLFSDVSGYSAICEKMDPEDVRDVMSRIFGEIVKIILRYEGYIERIIGDEILAVFGMPVVHEEDALRAIKAAIQIHKAVRAMSPILMKILGRPLSMHTGISSGLVVTGNIDLKDGKHGVTGDTVSKASHLTNRAGPDEILVCNDTYNASAGYFSFKNVTGHNRTDKLRKIDRVFKVIASVQNPKKVKRVHGVTARLVGRAPQLEALKASYDRLTNGRGSFVAVTGEAGTGKSRLISEFKSLLDLDAVAWVEGHTYAYAQSAPYFPVKDLLRRALEIKLDDRSDVISSKLNKGIEEVLGNSREVAPFIGSLFEIDYDEIRDINPESWKVKLRDAVIQVISGLSQTAPTIICLEDIHWADPSTLELLSVVLETTDFPILFICSYRTGYPRFEKFFPTASGYTINMLRLNALSPEESVKMVKSLLKTDTIPKSLAGILVEHLGGNPFYMEEAVNALIESGVLSLKHYKWSIKGAINETALSAGIFGVISSRLDRLDKKNKKLLQEAAIIGRNFNYEILKQITTCRQADMDKSLSELEQLDIIRKTDDQVELKYEFKHVIVQEVVYRSILKQDLKSVHEKIATVIEKNAGSRPDGVYETLSFHYSKGLSLAKAFKYIVKSGGASAKKYAMEEAHHYYARAYKMIVAGIDEDEKNNALLIDLMIKWFFVFNARGLFSEILSLLKGHEKNAMALKDTKLTGMYYACLGWTLQRKEMLKESYDCLLKALRVGEQINDISVTTYAKACMTWTCTDLGRLDDAVDFGRQAQEAIALVSDSDATEDFEMDQELVRFNMTGMAIAYWFRGESGKCREIGDLLLKYGEKGNDVNSISEGYLVHGMSRFAAGDYAGTIEKCNRAIDTSVEPLYSVNAKFLLGYTFLSLGRVKDAEETMDEIVRFTQTSGYEYIGTSANALLGVLEIAKGNITKGVKIINSHLEQYLKDGKKYHYHTFIYLLGRIYQQMVLKEESISFSAILKNSLFFIKNAPFAARKAEALFLETIEISKQISASGIRAQACYDLGRLYRAKKKPELAEQYLSKSIDLFEKCDADVHLIRAQDALSTLT